MTADSSVQVATDIVDTRQRAVIYCRVSTDDKGQTNETQERECRRWCEQMDYNVVEVYKDQSTGTNLNRVGFAMMQNRIINEGDIDFVVAYDQSRITRSDNLEQVRRTFMDRRCRLVFVADSASNSDDVGSRIVRNIKTVMNEEENNVRRVKTMIGMQTRKEQGKHLGRPARFVFVEDLASSPEGRYVPGKTVVYSYAGLLDLARQGISLRRAAETYVGVSYTTLMYEMLPCDPEPPQMEGESPSGRKSPDDSEKRRAYRKKGKVDRYTPYIQLYNEAISIRKGSNSERVGNPVEIDSERVVE